MTGLVHKSPLLPFIPPPFPDEVLGSWLSRIRIENGGGAWRVFTEHLGYRAYLQSTLFDMVDYEERLSKMFALLGTSYEQALLKLTTLPYWLTFSAAGNHSVLPGTTTIPALQGRLGVIKSIRKIGVGGERQSAFEPRYCPECISQDYVEVGQAYWHRAHQLPNVIFCHKHYCKLQVRCEACGGKPSGQNTRVLPLPTPNCQCGFRLDAVTNSDILSTQELRLISTSIRALHQAPPSWQRDDVLSFLQTQLAQGVSSPRGRYRRVLEKAFPEEAIQRSDCGKAGHEQIGLHFTRYLSMGSAPEFCALLAALDVDLDIAIAGFTAVGEERLNRLDLPKAKTGIMMVANVRLAICRAHKLYPERAISTFRRPYWYLRLYDAAWLHAQFPKILMAPIPTIDEDRVELKEILSSVDPSSPNVFFLARARNAGIRAKYRDEKWFDEQLAVSKQQMAVKRSVANNVLFLERAVSIHRALERTLSTEARPIRITASSLGALVGLSGRQVGSTLKSAPELREAIAAANADKLRRQLLWAAQQLINTGGRLTKKQLGIAAGVTSAKVSDQIFAEIKALHYCETPQ